ncbi:MAG: hypothetical protein RR891_02635 [Clostridium sp.]
MIEIYFRCKDGKCYYIKNKMYRSTEHFLKSIRFNRWISAEELGFNPFTGKVNKRDITFIWEHKDSQE